MSLIDFAVCPASLQMEPVNTAFSTKLPVIAINNLTTETNFSEQRAFSNILIGLFGAVRNPTAHDPKISWPMTEQDAVDIFAMISFVHRKLDGCLVTVSKQ